MAFITAHVSQLLMGVVCINIGLSAASQVLGALGKTVPGWLGTIATYGQKAVDFLSANVKH